MTGWTEEQRWRRWRALSGLQWAQRTLAHTETVSRTIDQPMEERKTEFLALEWTNAVK